ncbi:DMT family transporter [Kiloniella sp. b19]|uniref:DMT family transporter n=1 Tax=Kiloniella sp. GXU_MW_B19 TaxID=3141326 RepID=UPI0031D26AE1
MATNVVSRPNSQEQVLLGVACILFATAGMSLTDALIKYFSANITVWQVFVLRSAFALPCLYLIARWKGNALMPVSLFWTLMRSTFQVAGWLCFYVSLPLMSLSVAAVVVYTTPILTAIFAALIFKEEITSRQWVGVALGFAGVVVILRPWTGDVNWAVLMPFVSAIFYTVTVLVTRQKCRDERATTLTIWSQMTFITFGLAGATIVALLDFDQTLVAGYSFLLNSWPSLSAHEWGVLVAMGLTASVLFIAAARAYQIAPPQIIGTMDNSYLVWAALWSILLFDEIPDSLTLSGMALIFVAGGLSATRPLGGKSAITRR